MRSLVLVIVVLALAVTTSVGDARGRRPAKHAKSKKRVATDLEVDRIEAASIPTARARGQSFGVPWSGHLDRPTRLRGGDGYVIRHPWRAFATRTTVDHIREAVTDTLERFPHAHVLAIGDLSAEHGGAITDHHSHQSGRDADIGLIYKAKPAGYPQSFVSADADNLDRAATWKLVSEFAATADQDGGAQVMFLDFEVQGLLYKWAKDHGVSLKRLDRIFQFPHGRGANDGLVRHEPNHDNHLHVRFKCARADVDCR